VADLAERRDSAGIHFSLDSGFCAALSIVAVATTMPARAR
jgi:hypothetical protein